jgi:hypothetical protein
VRWWRKWKFEIELGLVVVFVALLTFDVITHLASVGGECSVPIKSAA